jgi:Zn-finger domain-containing protein
VLVSTGKIYGVAEDVSDLDVTNMMRQTFLEGARIYLKPFVPKSASQLINNKRSINFRS